MFSAGLHETATAILGNSPCSPINSIVRIILVIRLMDSSLGSGSRNLSLGAGQVMGVSDQAGKMYRLI